MGATSISSFDGIIVYPKSETKEEIFSESSEKIKSKLIPDETYTLKRKKTSEDKIISATAIIKNGSWTLLKGSILAINENAGGAKKAKTFRASLDIDENGKLLEDIALGECTPSFASSVVMNQGTNSWTDWKNKDGQSIEIYKRKKNND